MICNTQSPFSQENTLFQMEWDMGSLHGHAVCYLYTRYPLTVSRHTDTNDGA